jgi:hypothetical protein
MSLNLFSQYLLTLTEFYDLEDVCVFCEIEKLVFSYLQFQNSLVPYFETFHRSLHAGRSTELRTQDFGRNCG